MVFSGLETSAVPGFPRRRVPLWRRLDLLGCKNGFNTWLQVYAVPLNDLWLDADVAWLMDNGKAGGFEEETTILIDWCITYMMNLVIESVYLKPTSTNLQFFLKKVVVSEP